MSNTILQLLGMKKIDKYYYIINLHNIWTPEKQI